MAKRQGHGDLHFAQINAPLVEHWLGLTWPVMYTLKMDPKSRNM